MESTSENFDMTSSIEAGWKPVADLMEVWRYRTLLYFLCWRDLKVRYRQTILGAGWALAQPLCTTIVFSVLFGRIAKIPSGGIPYPLFTLAALIPWMYFSGALSRASLSVVSNAHLIGKVFFPRILIPVSSVVPGAVDFLISIACLFGMMLFFGYVPSILFIVALPVLILWIAALSLGLGLWLSTVHVRFRDIGHALPFFLQLLMYATPVIFPTDFVPEKYQWLLMLNPLTGIIDAFRSLLFDQPWNVSGAWISLGQTVFFLSTGLFFFQRKSRSFADVI